MEDPFLQPSNLNNYFIGDNLPFADYEHQMRQIIATARPDLGQEMHDIIINANSPYLWFPEDSSNQLNKSPIKRGVLLVHGLFDSPFTLKDIAHFLHKKGHLCAGILLPGHGTVPGDLLNIHYREWEKAVAYGVDTLKKYTNKVDIIGFSLGGALAIHHALKDPDIHSLTLISPALRAQTRLEIVLYLYRLMGRFAPPLKWYRKRPQVNFARYSSLATNGAFQAYHFIHHMRRQLAHKTLEMPICLIATESDETLCTPTTLKFFKNQPNEKNKMLLYTHLSHPFDSKIIVRTNVYPEENIIDFSHIATAISPDNPYLGRNASYCDFGHYRANYVPKGAIFKGAVTIKNLRKYTIQRLTYNPDFYNMLTFLDTFLESTM